MSNSKYLNTLVLQYKPLDKPDDNITKLDNILFQKKIMKNTLVICPELSIQKYICITKDKKLFKEAIQIDSPIIKRLKDITKKYRVFLCISFFHKHKTNFYNTVIVINPNGKIIQKYNKKNIPSEICYEEDYYFDTPKNNFKTFNVLHYKIGILICWDQWHSNSYQYFQRERVNLIICPTAIGNTKINNKTISLNNEKDKWHEIIKANSLMINTPIIISNRIGKESAANRSITFWGSSFITNSNGDIVKKCPRGESTINHKIFIKDQITSKRMWNFIN